MRPNYEIKPLIQNLKSYHRMKKLSSMVWMTKSINDLAQLLLKQFSKNTRFCSSAVEHAPNNQKVMGLNPARCWPFLSSLISYHSFFVQKGPLWRCINSDQEVDA